MAGESIAQGGRVVGRALKHAYEYAGTNIVLSLLWFLFALMPTLLTLMVVDVEPGINSIAIALAALLFLFGPVTATVYSVAFAVVEKDDLGLFPMLWAHTKTHFKEAAKVTAANFAILAILIIDFRFFSQHEKEWIAFLSVIWLYLLFVWLLMFQYVYPVMVRQRRKEREVKVLEVLKMSVLLALDNIVASVIMLLASVAIVIISMFFRVPVLMFMAGTIGFLHVTGLTIVIEKYGRDEESDDDGTAKSEDHGDDSQDGAGDTSGEGDGGRQSPDRSVLDSGLEEKKGD